MWSCSIWTLSLLKFKLPRKVSKGREWLSNIEQSKNTGSCFPGHKGEVTFWEKFLGEDSSWPQGLVYAVSQWHPIGCTSHRFLPRDVYPIETSPPKAVANNLISWKTVQRTKQTYPILKSQRDLLPRIPLQNLEDISFSYFALLGEIFK